MPNKMLIDATHPEETRVVVLRGHRVEEFDFESANRKQLRGNIYLAKVTRVEPSLQAAFVDYGGNRHGFLAFSEIHPDYYRIPVSDRPAGESEPQTPEESGDDNGVPLAAALPEPVSVPESAAAEDEPAGDQDRTPEPRPRRETSRGSVATRSKKQRRPMPSAGARSRPATTRSRRS